MRQVFGVEKRELRTHGTQIVKNMHEMFFNARPEQVTQAMHF